VLVLLTEMNVWHWLILGFVLLFIEMTTGSGYLLWFGLSGLVVGLLLAVFDISWQLQWLMFSLLSLAISWAWWFWQHQKDVQDEQTSLLNQRDKQMLGHTFVLELDLAPGRNRIQLGDTSWAVEVETPLRQGERVQVVALDGIVLKLARVSQST
jgi:inner membrane protein